MTPTLRTFLVLALFLPLSPFADAESPSPLAKALIEYDKTFTVVVYSLADFGNDPQFAAWIVKTIPKQVEPRYWAPTYPHTSDRPVILYGSLQYFAPAKILVVRQPPAIQAKVADFLSKMKTAASQHAPMPVSNTTHVDNAPTVGVVQTGHVTSVPRTPSQPPAVTRFAETKVVPTQAPQHLFHIILDGFESKVPNDSGVVNEYKVKNFTIRYEGEGIIDSHIVEMFKLGALQGAAEELAGMATAMDWLADQGLSLWHKPAHNKEPAYIATAWEDQTIIRPDGCGSTKFIRGNLYLFGPKLDRPLLSNGSVALEMSEICRNGEQKVRESWHIDSASLARLVERDVIGDHYRLTLPLAPETVFDSEVIKVRMRVVFTTPSGNTIYAEPSGFSLETPNSDQESSAASLTPFLSVETHLTRSGYELLPAGEVIADAPRPYRKW